MPGDAGAPKTWGVVIHATTNNVKSGGKDDYQLLGEVDLAQQHYLADVKPYPSAFYKVVVEAPNNSVNQWMIIK